MGILVNTKHFGEVEVDEKQVIDFPEGILGFDFIKKFVLLDTKDENNPFKWLQAFDEQDLAFIVIRPVDFMGEYELAVTPSDIEAVDAKSHDELIVFAIVTLPEKTSDMTANLQGPIIINPEKRLGRQAISLSDRYHVRHRILDEVKSGDEG